MCVWGKGCFLNALKKKQNLCSSWCVMKFWIMSLTHIKINHVSKLMNNIILNCFLSYFPCFFVIFLCTDLQLLLMRVSLVLDVFRNICIFSEITPDCSVKNFQFALNVCIFTSGFINFLSLSACHFSFITVQILLYKNVKLFLWSLTFSFTVFIPHICPKDCFVNL